MKYFWFQSKIPKNIITISKFNRMPSIFPFETAILFSSLSILLLIGLILRAKIKIIQKFFIPACIIGGIIALFLREAGFLPISVSSLEAAVYHLFNITFISLGLSPRSQKEMKSKRSFRDVVIMGLLIVSVALLQFIIGGIIVLLFGFSGLTLFPTFGFLVTLGFEVGPGQALSIGKSWEASGFSHAATIGLSFATIGFLFAIFVGVPLTSWMIKKGKSKFYKKNISGG